MPFSFATTDQQTLAATARAAVQALADEMAVDGDDAATSYARAAVAIGADAPDNCMGVIASLTDNDKAALELREIHTGQTLAAWLIHFGA